MAVDKLVDSTQLDAGLTSVANAIRTKGGTSADLAFPAGFVSAVEAIPTGGGGEEAPENDVVFWDYDGTRVYSYTKAEFLALSAMPDNPSHSGLVAQGWNWSLADAQEYVAIYGECDIGQSYTTTDGKTRVFIEIPYPGTTDFKILWTQSKDNGVTINWGDGSEEESFSGTGNKNATHNYDSPGNYTITLSPDSDCDVGLGATNVGPFTGNGNTEYWRSSCVKGVHIGDNYPLIYPKTFTGSYSSGMRFVSIPVTVTEIGADAFSSNTGISYVTVPTNCTTIGSSFLSTCRSLKRVSLPRKNISFGNSNSVFYQCDLLKRLVFPDKISVLHNGMLSNCATIQRFTIPNGVTTIGGNAFTNCYSIRYLTIPSTVTLIEGQAFSVMRGLIELHMLSTVPPTVENSNAFYQMNGTIYVPYSADHSILDAYKAATNWSTVASKIVEESP